MVMIPTRLLSSSTNRIHHLVCMSVLFSRGHCNGNERSETTQVTIGQGPLVGKTYKSRNGSSFYSFTKIPFAKPPVGDLRFEPPQEAGPWEGVLDATVLPSPCPQQMGPELRGKEDCLYLNVFTAEPNENKNLPVLVYIHGGAYVLGSGTSNWPTYFMDKPIVFVSITYRVGALGFLAAADEVWPGNMALKDQSMALRWIQKNIRAFGGDPEKVTIFGESAGASSVSFQMHSPLSKGTFRSAIMQSGSSYSTWALIPQKLARQRLLAFATLTGCPTTSTKGIMEFLKKLPVEEILRTQNKFFTWDKKPNIAFAPVVEPDIEGAFLPKSPWNQDAVNNVPYIAGYNSGEGGLKVTRFISDDGLLLFQLRDNYKRYFPLSLNYNNLIEDDKTCLEVTEKIKKFYLGEKEIGFDNIMELRDLYTDAYFGYCTQEAARRHKNINKVYFYLYDHRNQRSINDILGNNKKYNLGVCHSDELISLFDTKFLAPEGVHGDDLVVSERMISYWVNFAYNGNPNAEGEEVWKPLETDNLEYLHIKTHGDVMEDKLHQDRYNFWKDLPFIKSLSEPKVMRDEL